MGVFRAAPVLFPAVSRAALLLKTRIWMDMADKMVLSGQVAVVTGAARGIGEAVSCRLASLGMHVWLLARDKQRLQAVRSAIRSTGGEAEVYPMDLRDEGAIAAFGDQLQNAGGRCDVLVNNAAVGRFGSPLHEMSPEAWDETLSTNLRAPFLLIRALAPLMIRRGDGHIINVSSLAGHNPVANGAAYSASKWGLNGLTYSVAEELRPHGVRVSVVAPGSVHTDFGGGTAADDDKARRKIQPDDVANIVEMLVRQAPQSFVSEVLIRPTQKP